MDVIVNIADPRMAISTITETRRVDKLSVSPAPKPQSRLRKSMYLDRKSVAEKYPITKPNAHNPPLIRIFFRFREEISKVAPAMKPQIARPRGAPIG